MWKKVITIRSDGIVLSMMSIMYGTTIFMFPNILETYRVYEMIRDIVDNHKVGLVFVVLGALKLFGIIINSKTIRMIAIRCLTFLWVLFLIGFIITPPPNSVWLMALSQIYLIYKAMEQEG